MINEIEINGERLVDKTVSGTSISFGTPVVFDSNDIVSYISVTYDSANDKAVIAYMDRNNYSYLSQAIVGEISGTSISFPSSPTVFHSNNVSSVSSTYSSAGKVVIAFTANMDNDRGKAVETVSGTTITLVLLLHMKLSFCTSFSNIY